MIFDKLIISTDLLNSISKSLFAVCVRNFESQYLTFTCWLWLSQYLNRRSIWQLCGMVWTFIKTDYNIFSFIKIVIYLSLSGPNWKLDAIALSGNMVSNVECKSLAELLENPLATETKVHTISALTTSLAETPWSIVVCYVAEVTSIFSLDDDSSLKSMVLSFEDWSCGDKCSAFLHFSHSLSLNT